TGVQIQPGNTLFQLVALAKKNPRLLAQSVYLLTIPDLLTYWLSTKIGCERYLAMTTQFLDCRTRLWSWELLRAAGLPTHLLPPIQDAAGIVGPLEPSLAQSPGLEDTQVVAPMLHTRVSAQILTTDPEAVRI